MLLFENKLSFFAHQSDFPWTSKSCAGWPLLCDVITHEICCYNYIFFSTKKAMMNDVFCNYQASVRKRMPWRHLMSFGLWVKSLAVLETTEKLASSWLAKRISFILSSSSSSSLWLATPLSPIAEMLVNLSELGVTTDDHQREHKSTSVAASTRHTNEPSTELNNTNFFNS